MSHIPRSTAQALCDPHWKSSMDVEMFALTSNRTWDLVPPPSRANILGFHWLYHHKFDSKVQVDR